MHTQIIGSFQGHLYDLVVDIYINGVCI